MKRPTVVILKIRGNVIVEVQQVNWLSWTAPLNLHFQWYNHGMVVAYELQE